MIKNLIKIANEFDRLGLKKEADQIDAIIRKVSSHDEDYADDGKIRYHGRFFADEGMASKIHPSYKGKRGGMFNWDYSPMGGKMIDIYSSHPWEDVAPQYLTSMSEEDLKGYI
jgi:hypothetical protein